MRFHLVAFENLEEILNLMVMNGVFFSTVNDPYIRQKFSKSAATFIGKTFQKQRPAVIQIQLCLWH
jgi:hypothetical protein